MERSKGEDTTAQVPTLCRGGVVPVRGANNAIDFDRYRIAGYYTLGVSADGSGHGRRGRGDATMRRKAVSRDFDRIWWDDNRSRITV